MRQTTSRCGGGGGVCGCMQACLQTDPWLGHPPPQSQASVPARLQVAVRVRPPNDQELARGDVQAVFVNPHDFRQVRRGAAPLRVLRPAWCMPTAARPARPCARAWPAAGPGGGARRLLPQRHARLPRIHFPCRPGARLAPAGAWGQSTAQQAAQACQVQHSDATEPPHAPMPAPRRTCCACAASPSCWTRPWTASTPRCWPTARRAAARPSP